MSKSEVAEDNLYSYNVEEHNNFCDKRPWKKSAKYFNSVKISSISLLKMVMHCTQGVPLEVMGLLQGKIEEHVFIITDVFALPVEGTETRVNAQEEALGYMADYLEQCKEVGRLENAVGWYHSHPGYGCWLSGVDVTTQNLQQMYNEPWLAIVVDPVRTISSGKVEIGAFRTYPKDYVPKDEESQYQTIPLEKIEDFGVHARSYYQLPIEFFKSSLDKKLLDLLWNQYWLNTLSTSPIITNKDFVTGQIKDLTRKLENAQQTIGFGRQYQSKGESQLRKVSKDGSKAAIEQINGLVSQVVKNSLFNSRKQLPKRKKKKKKKKKKTKLKQNKMTYLYIL
ncbi:cop9 signalosome complex subunit [Anaeramoeba flamelloides]|uniref:Cop9 signalosome complex subunit n=1 Tax=Anaeramoeba flamelloides TaxID=1746091 RepID=A0AAV7ZH62_9EUKA|nr:cop9 signalosome complex subunit [Anaeramoeba flamelloides]